MIFLLFLVTIPVFFVFWFLATALCMALGAGPAAGLIGLVLALVAIGFCYRIVLRIAHPKRTAPPASSDLRKPQHFH